jgi:hypothetical protein
MITYRQCPPEPLSGTVFTVMRFNDDDSTSGIQFNQSNMDYQHFKIDIESENGQLQDVDGNLLTAEQAKEYVRTLP